MKKLIIATALTFAAYAPAIAADTKLAAPAAAASNQSARQPKGCPDGFIKWGVITKIEKNKKGMVAETIRTNDGTIQKMPSFKANNLYVNKVGDAFCMDTTPDND